MPDDGVWLEFYRKDEKDQEPQKDFPITRLKDGNIGNIPLLNS